MKEKKYSGFTMVEMLVVITLIVFLAAIGLVEYANFDRKARRNASLVSAKAIADALRLYKAENNKYTVLTRDLAKYVNMTALLRSFDQTTTDPAGGLTIFTSSATPRPWCVFGAPRGLNKRGVNYNGNGSYNISFCVETNETSLSTMLANQPACRYRNEAGVLVHDWQRCDRE